jgi:hypothetical protein
MIQNIATHTKEFPSIGLPVDHFIVLALSEAIPQ